MRVVTLLLVLWLALPACSEQSRGVVYYLEGGSGAGQVWLFSQGKLVRLNFVDGQYRQVNMQRPGAWSYGAIWLAEHRDGKLESVRFTGDFSIPVRNATVKLLAHYESLFRRRYKDAYADLSPAWREQQSYEQFLKGQAKVTYQNPNMAPVFGMKVVGAQPHQVQIEVDAHYYVDKDTNRYLFTLIERNGNWWIDRVETQTNSSSSGTR